VLVEGRTCDPQRTAVCLRLQSAVTEVEVRGSHSGESGPALPVVGVFVRSSITPRGGSGRASCEPVSVSSIHGLFVWADLAYKLWLKVLLLGLVCEKNIVR